MFQKGKIKRFYKNGQLNSQFILYINVGLYNSILGYLNNYYANVF